MSAAVGDVRAVLARGPVRGWAELSRLSGWSPPTCRKAVASMGCVEVRPTRPPTILYRRHKHRPPPVSVRDLLAEQPRTVAELVEATGYSDRHVRAKLADCAVIAEPRPHHAPATYRLREGA